MNNLNFPYLKLKIISSSCGVGTLDQKLCLYLLIFIFDEKYWQEEFIIFNIFNSLEMFSQLMVHSWEKGEEINAPWLEEHLGTSEVSVPKGQEYKIHLVQAGI
jgi:hypothetical protein